MPYAVVQNQDLLKKNAKGALISLALKTSLSKIPLFCDILF